ncbi:hypothetical protein WP50_15680, partial [Lactiplantibacillus plantarum]
MGKKRIYELAEEVNVPSKQLIAQAQQLGFSVKNHMSTLGDSEARQLQGTTTVTHPKSQPAPAKTSRAKSFLGCISPVTMSFRNGTFL